MTTALVLLLRPDLWVVLLSTVQEYTEVKSMIREGRFQLWQHQSMWLGALKIHGHVEVQHLTSVMRIYHSFKIQSSSLLPTICDKTACKVLIRTGVFMLYSVHCFCEKSLSHCSHSGLGETSVTKYRTCFILSSKVYEKWMPSELKPCSSLMKSSISIERARFSE